MKAEEIFNNKPYMTAQDIMKLFCCGKSKAYQIIREIKNVSDTLPFKGRVAQVDYEKWIKGGNNNA